MFKLFLGMPFSEVSHSHPVTAGTPKVPPPQIDTKSRGPREHPSCCVSLNWSGLVEKFM